MKGFTLIELLVVVLIIGILSAVALPQYQKAVAKSRVAEGQILLDGIIKAQMVYQMANGEMASKLSDLDISLPCELDDEATHPTYICNNWHLDIIYPDTASRYIEIFPSNIRNLGGFALSYRSDGGRSCRALENSSLQNFLCKDLGYTLYRAGVEGGGAVYSVYRK
ncbi:MAG: prepilin-type N-terminal cleavage/methylation domain-containing protein [Elusimicrobiaceae bacterium]|nr:prepilin-type N-terminal cleavage/methylation domain-containing protein [Elusimicrobiaceae bacterium]